MCARHANSEGYLASALLVSGLDLKFSLESDQPECLHSVSLMVQGYYAVFLHLLSEPRAPSKKFFRKKSRPQFKFDFFLGSLLHIC